MLTFVNAKNAVTIFYRRKKKYKIEIFKEVFFNNEADSWLNLLKEPDTEDEDEEKELCQT